MPFDLNTLDPSKVLNFGICAVIALFGTFFLLSLLGNPGESIQGNSKRDHSFVFKAFTCWVISWWAWVVLWGFAAFVKGNRNEALILSLSDCNTVLLVLFYLGLTRGKTYELARYIIHGL